MKYLCLAAWLAIILADVHAGNQADVPAGNQIEVLADVPPGLEPRAKDPRKSKKRCPSGWSKFGSYCYRYFAAPLNFEDAANVCEIHLGWLTSVQSAAENRFIASLVPTGNTWIGLFRTSVDPFWAWIDGFVVSYTNYITGEPNNKGGTEDCTEMYNWKWNDQDCGDLDPYVCQKPI